MKSTLISIFAILAAISLAAPFSGPTHDEMLAQGAIMKFTPSGGTAGVTLVRMFDGEFDMELTSDSITDRVIAATISVEGNATCFFDGAAGFFGVGKSGSDLKVVPQQKIARASWVRGLWREMGRDEGWVDEVHVFPRGWLRNYVFLGRL